jgi:hypothetical protein
MGFQWLNFQNALTLIFFLLDVAYANEANLQIFEKMIIRNALFNHEKFFSLLIEVKDLYLSFKFFSEQAQLARACGDEKYMTPAELNALLLLIFQKLELLIKLLGEILR